LTVGESLDVLLVVDYGRQVSLVFVSGYFLSTFFVHFDPRTEIVLLFVVDLVIEVLIKRVVENGLVVVLPALSMNFAGFRFGFSPDDDSRACLVFWRRLAFLTHNFIKLPLRIIKPQIYG
jgi:hypothetical protein